MRIRLLLLTLVLLLLVGLTTAQDTPQYAIVTHYPDVGGVEPAPRDALQASYGVYNNRENDYYAVTQERAQEVVAMIEAETGLKVAMLNNWEAVTEDSAALQIVNNVPVEGALYTIFLPPGWQKDAKLPVLLSGNGAGTSNNRRFFNEPEIIMPRLVAASVSLAGQGFIGVMSNAGGTESQGIDDVTYCSVGAFLNWLDQNGGDKDNVVTAGGSRGGGSALMWAINPLDLDYTVRAVFAEVPPTHYGTLSQISPLTYPSMFGIGTLVSGDENAWRYDSDHPYLGLNPSPLMEVLIGTGVPEDADARSAFGLAEKLRGKKIIISEGAHDAFFPLFPFLAFDRRLTELDIPHGTFVTLDSGHEMHAAWIQQVTAYMLGRAHGLDLPVARGRQYFIDVNPAAEEEMPLAEFFQSAGITDDPGQLPVIARFPYRAGVGNPFNVEICGTPGDTVELTAINEAGAVFYQFAGVIDETECHFETLTVQAEPAVYQWSLMVNGQEINPRNTPSRESDGCGLRAVTFVQSEQPEPKFLYAFNHDLAFGLSEYSGQPDSCR